MSVIVVVVVVIDCTCLTIIEFYRQHLLQNYILEFSVLTVLESVGVAISTCGGGMLSALLNHRRMEIRKCSVRRETMNDVK